MDINSRVKKIRLSVGLNQNDFGKKIAVAQGYLSQLENGDREVTEKILRLICLEFNVNEVWLRTGKGDMYVQTDNTIIEELASKYHMSDKQKKIIAIFASMDEKKREVLAEVFFEFADALIASPEVSAMIATRPAKNDYNLTREEKESMMKRQLDKEEKVATSSAFTFINGSDGEKMA